MTKLPVIGKIKLDSLHGWSHLVLRWASPDLQSTVRKEVFTLALLWKKIPIFFFAQIMLNFI
jgi:hypothetical protein